MEPTTTAAIVTAFGTIIVALISYFGAKQVRTARKLEDVHDSVNHRHEKSGGRGVMDILLETREDVGEIKGKLESVSERVREHSEQLADLAARPPCKHPELARVDTARVRLDRGGEGDPGKVFPPG